METDGKSYTDDYSVLVTETNFYQYRGNISLIVSTSSEAKASALIENIKEMFPGYYMHSDIQQVQSSTTQYCVTRVNHFHNNYMRRLFVEKFTLYGMS